MFRYPWQQSVIDAAREFDPLDQYAKVQKAEAAIQERISVLCEDGNPEEREALVEAMKTLQILRKGFDSH
jgi:hypothetical protein